MAHVMVLDSFNEDVFVCGNCKSVFNSLPCYLEHKKLTCNGVLIENLLPTNENLQLQQDSDEDEAYLSQDREGIKNKNDNDLKCKVCSKEFKKIKGLLNHVRLHKGKPYQCPVCGRCFIQNSHLQRHTLSHKVWPGSVTNRTPRSKDIDFLSYSCPYCNKLSINYGEFRIHLQCHSDLKQYKCIQDECPCFYENINALLGHVSDKHPTPVYKCHMCHENFNTLENIALHQQSHTNFVSNTKLESKNYKCSQCEAIFKNPQKLTLHMLTENHNKICNSCNKTFASEKRLRMHLQIHRESKPFVCNTCGRGFHIKKYLKSHMLKHSNKSFQCDICKSMFRRQDLVQRHMRLHQSKKMYPCPFDETCKKEFSRRDKLTAHLKCHAKSFSTQTTENKRKKGSTKICKPKICKKKNKNPK